MISVVSIRGFDGINLRLAIQRRYWAIAKLKIEADLQGDAEKLVAAFDQLGIDPYDLEAHRFRTSLPFVMLPWEGIPRDLSIQPEPFYKQDYDENMEQGGIVRTFDNAGRELR